MLDFLINIKESVVVFPFVFRVDADAGWGGVEMAGERGL